jgi:hypothetical protein
MLLYFAVENVNTRVILIHNIVQNRFSLYSPTPQDQTIVRQLVQRIRHTIRFTDAFFDLGAYHHRVLPNMKHRGTSWDTEKAVLAEQKHEITKVYRCTVNHRTLAWKQGLHSWKECTAEQLGFQQKTADIINAILDINRNTSQDWIKIHDQVGLYSLVHEPVDTFCYVDFEWVNNSIYLIGLFDNVVGYQALWADTLTDSQDIVKTFEEIIGDRPIVYWYAEKTRWKSEMERLQHVTTIKESQWMDLHRIFHDGIVVRGAFDFKLKNVAKAFFDQGHMPYFIDDFECQNGADSIILAQEYYKTRSPETRDNIEKYNRFDCESLSVITKKILERIK